MRAHASGTKMKSRSGLRSIKPISAATIKSKVMTFPSFKKGARQYAYVFILPAKQQKPNVKTMLLAAKPQESPCERYENQVEYRIKVDQTNQCCQNEIPSHLCFLPNGLFSEPTARCLSHRKTTHSIHQATPEPRRGNHSKCTRLLPYGEFPILPSVTLTTSSGSAKAFAEGNNPAGPARLPRWWRQCDEPYQALSPESSDGV